MTTTKKPKPKSVTLVDVKRWHYTIANYMPSIMADGLIKPATANVPRGQRPIVWFSSNPVWEETANKSYIDNGNFCKGDKQQTERIGGGLCRIAVLPETAPHDWERLIFLGKIPPAEARALEQIAIEEGANPAEWFGTFYPVESSKWIAVDKLVDGVWQAYDALDTIA